MDGFSCEYRLETIDIMLNKLEKDEYFDYFDRIMLNILFNDYKEILKGKKRNEHKGL